MASEDGVTLWLPNQHMKERANVPATRVENLRQIQGYLIPTYVDVLDDGRRVAALDARQVQRVRDGYACGKCLAYFGERLWTCPSCGERLDANEDIVDFMPDYWKDGPSRTSEEINRDLA